MRIDIRAYLGVKHCRRGLGIIQAILRSLLNLVDFTQVALRCGSELKVGSVSQLHFFLPHTLLTHRNPIASHLVMSHTLIAPE